MNASRDNLYKWCMISGLVIGLFALTIPYPFVDGINQRHGPLEASTRREEIEVNDLFQKTDKLDKALRAEGQADASGVVVNTMSEDEKKSGEKSLADSQLALNIKYAEIKASNAELSRLHVLGVLISGIGLVLFAVGAGLFIYGFKQWYLKVQSIEDYLLQNELDRIASERTVKK